MSFSCFLPLTPTQNIFHNSLAEKNIFLMVLYKFFFFLFNKNSWETFMFDIFLYRQLKK